MKRFFLTLAAIVAISNVADAGFRCRGGRCKNASQCQPVQQFIESKPIRTAISNVATLPVFSPENRPIIRAVQSFGTCAGGVCK